MLGYWTRKAVIWYNTAQGNFTMFAVLPIAVLVVALSFLKLPTWKAALLALAAGAVDAWFFSALAPADIVSCAARGAATGLFPIGLVIVAALFLYAVTVESGAIEDIKAGLATLSDDRCFMALLIAWGFGNFMEGMAGFGTAVAIPCAILVGIGFDPVKAVLCCLVANTTPTAFGSAGVPTMVLASETGLELGRLSFFAALLQLAATALLPFLVLFIVGGWRAVRERAALAAVAVVAFIVPWLAAAAWLGCEMPDILGGISTMAVFAAMGRRGSMDVRRQLRAWMPFAFVVAALGLGIAAAALGCPRVSPGVLILVAAFVGGLAQGIRPVRLFVLVAITVRKYVFALLAICLVLALARIMGESGMTKTLAESLSGFAGRAYPAISSLLGSLGGFMTGSGTSSNVLFGMLQASVGELPAEKMLYAASNVMGAGIGKMISPQSIVLGCAAAGLAGRESETMKRALPYFIAVLAVSSVATVLFAVFQA